MGLDTNLTVQMNYIFILPSELQIIVSEEWKTAGFGLPKDSNGRFVVTQVFGGRDYAAVTLTKLEIAYYRGQLTDLISSKYPRILDESKKLSTLVSEWQNGD